MKTIRNKQQEDSDQMYIDPKQINKTGQMQNFKKGIMLSEIDRERQIWYDSTYVWNLKKHNKLVSITKKEADSQREQTSRYQRGEGRGEVEYRGRGPMYKINKLQGYIVQHGEYNKYFI